jgi:D-glycero-D-manno-heptose 1,7-bisphosphate phosphatase
MDTADRNYNIWEVLPGRLERLRNLDGPFGIVTNQAGVAFGHITESDVRYKLHQVAIALGWMGVELHDGGLPVKTREVGPLPVWACYAHPKARNPRYRIGHERRKPSPNMLREAMDWGGFSSDQTIYVGDREEDEQAAKAAGVRFQWAHIFFKE